MSRPLPEPAIMLMHGDLVVTATLPEGEYSVVTPASADPADPEPPDLSDDLSKLAMQIDLLSQRVQDAGMEVDAMVVSLAAQEAHIDALFTDQTAHAAKLAELDAAIQRIEQRTLALEDAKAAALSALEQMREALL